MFRFEKAALEDAETLARVQERAFSADARLYGGGPPGYDSAAWQAEMMTQSPYYAIWDQDRIVGGVLAVDEGAGHYYLKRIFVDPDVQNRGAASAALAFIEKALPARRWTLHTPYRSYSNQRFYEKRGYRKIGELHPDDVENVTDDFLLFHYEKIMPDTT